MPSHEEELLWPSDDSDTPGDGGKTAQLPVPEGQQTAHLPAPPQLPESPTVWVSRAAQQRGPSSGPQRQQAQQDNERRQPHQAERRQVSPEQAPRPQAQPGAPERWKHSADSPQRTERWQYQAEPPSRPQLKQPQMPPPVWSQRPALPPQQPPLRPAPSASTARAEPMRIDPAEETQLVEAVPADDPPAPDTASDTAPPRRRRRGLIFGGLALLLVVALGVAASLPDVSNRLGLPWAPNLPKGDTPDTPTVDLALKAPAPSAPTPTSSGVAAALAGPAGNPALGTLTGAVVDPATGGTLWDHSSSQPLTPASTTKLLTMAAALLTLDHGLQLSTRVVAGPSPDTAILVAGGDPTLSTLADGQKSIYPGAAHLDDLVSQVKKATGGSIRKVQIDLSLYSGAQTAPGWAPDDAPSTYAAPITPGMLDAGLTDPTNEHAPRVADPANTLLQEFAQRLGASAAGTTTAPKTAKVLGEVRSAPLTELIDTTLELSDDTLAEMIGRQTAIAAGAPATFDGTAQTTMNVLSQNGFDLSGVQLRDGSGLSTANKIPARLLAQLLAAAAGPDGKDQRTAKLRPMLEGLPVAGGSGTLSDRYHDPSSSAGRGWVRAKTGTLDGVNTLAGVVLDSDGRVLSFALMSNGSNMDSGRAGLDAVAGALRGCGCR